MSSRIFTGNVVHDQNRLNALVVLQSALVGNPTAAAVRLAYIQYYQSLLASGIQNKCGTDPFRAALRELKAGSA